MDYAGQTMPITNPRTGEIRQAQIFVGTMGASDYLFCEATETPTEEWSDTGTFHVTEAYELSVTENQDPTNSKTDSADVGGGGGVPPGTSENTLIVYYESSDERAIIDLDITRGPPEIDKTDYVWRLETKDGGSALNWDNTEGTFRNEGEGAVTLTWTKPSDPQELNGHFRVVAGFDFTRDGYLDTYTEPCRVLYVTVVKRERLVLGGSKTSIGPTLFEVYVPTKRDGKLTIHGNFQDLKYPDGTPFANGTEIGEDKHGWYSFLVLDSSGYEVSNEFVQEHALSQTPWCTWWYPYDVSTADPHLWEDPATYPPGEQGALKKFDLLNPLTDAFDWEVTNAKEDSGAGNRNGHCDAAAHAGFCVSKPEGDKTLGGIVFREKDRLGIAVERYWIGLGPDVDEPGNVQQLFLKRSDNVTADWFHRKLRKRIGDDEGGVVVYTYGFYHGVYEYSASFTGWGTANGEERAVTVVNEMKYKKWTFDQPEETRSTGYSIFYDEEGVVEQELAWPESDRPDGVVFSKEGGVLVNDAIDQNRDKADSIIAP